MKFGLHVSTKVKFNAIDQSQKKSSIKTKVIIFFF